MSARDLFYPKNKTFSDAEEKAFAREQLVYNVTEDLLIVLEDLNINKKELARRLGKSKSYITQILSGSRNMTLGSFSDICFVLGVEPEIKVSLKEEAPEKISTEDDDWITFVADSPRKSSTGTKKQSNIIDKRNPENWEKAA